MSPQSPIPPKWADRFLEWFCHPHLLEEIQGDAYELFERRCKKEGVQIARRRFTWDVLRSFRLSTIKNINPTPIMLRNNFKTAFRQIKRQKFYSAVNIIGLALGIACCLLIALYIKDELSYDKQHRNIDNLYRISLDINLGEWASISNAIPPILPKTMAAEIPEVAQVARLNPYFGNAGTNLVKKEGETNNQFEENFVYADQSLFELFDLPLIFGDKVKLLTEPQTIVITKKIADKYYPYQDPVGETFVLNNDVKQSFKITGVIENIPDQSHFHFDFFISMPSLADAETNTTWVSNNYYGYLALKEETNPTDLKQKFHDFSLRHFAPQFKEVQNIDLIEKAKNGEFYRVTLQPVSEIHLFSGEHSAFLEDGGDIRYVRIFGMIAFFIFIIALVNFVNLSIARSANRAKEVGVRKVLGSFRSQLVTQFLIESTLMSFIAFILGGFMAHYLLPYFNELSGKDLSIPFTNLGFYPLLFGLAIIVGLIAGGYPAFYLSSFQPAKVLKGKLSRGTKSGWLRSGLVIGQFAISIGLIIGTIVVYQQMNFIQNKKIGFDKDRVMLINDTYTLGDQAKTFRNALKEIPEIKNATMTPFLPLDGARRNSMAFNAKGENVNKEQFYIQAWPVDENYLPTLDMKIKTGRNFSLEMKTDNYAVILNETAVKNFGLEDPIGQQIESPFLDAPYTVIGIVEDFNYESLKGQIRGLGMFLSDNNETISVKANTKDMSNIIQKTEALWKTYVPTQPFRYTFLDDRFATMYVTESRVSQLFTIFSLLAIFIACLGLFAMATFMTAQRTKEIGIRKVLGASTFNIVLQLSKNFLYLVLLGLLIAAPIAYFQMEAWLNNFEYRIDMEWWMFALSGLLVLIIAFFTVGGQSLRAAMANPINSLKAE